MSRCRSGGWWSCKGTGEVDICIFHHLVKQILRAFGGRTWHSAPPFLELTSLLWGVWVCRALKQNSNLAFR